MGIRTSCQILLGVLLAAVALSVLGLAADNISYANKHHGSPVDIHYLRWNETAQAQYSYWVTMDYVPSRFSVGPMVAMLISCLLCAIVGAFVAVGSWMMRDGSKEENKRSIPLLPTSMVLTTIAFLTSLAIAIYVWHPVSISSADFLKSLPSPPSLSTTTPTNGLAVFQSTFAYTPEVWNCMLAEYVVQPGQSRKLRTLCREAGIAKYLMVPTLIFSAVLLFSLVWTWRQARRSAASDAENAGAKEVEEVSVHSKE